MDRISAAQSRVRAVRAELHSPARYFPCVQCRYFELVCTHPAVSEISVNPVSGKASTKPGDPDKARAEDGPCGPEGALFDARSIPGQIIVGFVISAAGKWIIFLGAVALLDSLLR